MDHAVDLAELNFQELPPSSPPSIVSEGISEGISEGGTYRKPKRPASCTPRTFARFFTPRSLLNSGSSAKKCRQALQALSSPAINQLALSANRSLNDVKTTPSRKRKLSFSSTGSLQSSPLRKVNVARSIYNDIEQEKKRVKTIGHVQDIYIEEDSEPEDLVEDPREYSYQPPVQPIKRASALATGGGVFMRSIARNNRADRTTLRSNIGAGWQDETASFFSRPEDLHRCTSHGSGHLALPFVTASCKTNSLVAVGDEEGGVRLLESARNGNPGFSTAFLTLRPHSNAIMDLEFSSDDKLLATASGDQTARIIDMPTQKAIYCLSNHTSSVKRVQFQPGGNDNVMATCSRDGTVSMWDLRCKGFEKPAIQLQCSLDSDDARPTASSTLKYPQVLNSIHGAHVGIVQPKGRAAVMEAQSPARREDISVTSLAFLHPGRENLFITSGEHSACVRLWDIRVAYNIRRGRPLPLATTRQPEHHIKHRPFGVTSMAFSGDGLRLYTASRENAVYVYSTNHLILGHAPELSAGQSRVRRTCGPDKDGLDPLYGFRHPSLKVSSFYVRLAVRKAVDDKNEMLAVGSSDHCAILFPTDERYLDPSNSFSPCEKNQPTNSADLPQETPRQGLQHSNSGVGISGRTKEAIPMYGHGAALVEGHTKEVTAVSWTHDGELITVSDDFRARCWREGPDARDLRKGGNAEGRRWHCGWSNVTDSFDDEDE